MISVHVEPLPNPAIAHNHRVLRAAGVDITAGLAEDQIHEMMLMVGASHTTLADAAMAWLRAKYQEGLRLIGEPEDAGVLTIEAVHARWKEQRSV